LIVKLEDFQIAFRPLPGAAPVFCAEVNAIEWIAACKQVHEHGGRLVALWGGQRTPGFVMHVALAAADGLVVLSLPLPRELPSYPGVEGIFPAAVRMQRAAYDLLGIEAQGSDDRRPWLRHAAWPAGVFPLRDDFAVAPGYAAGSDEYAFVAVAGDGVHEIPVGPVHAGTIEPGHFRFSIIGERVLRLEERLGYKHKGIEKRFAGMTLDEGARLAARVSGDSSVAYGWAYAMAAEGVCGTAPPPRAAWLRALLLERERIANHLGDLGFIGNDAGLSFGLSQFSLLKEDMLRVNAALFGHRYLMDAIVTGGVARDIAQGPLAQLLAEADEIEKTVVLLKNIYDEHPGLQDRFISCGRVTPELASRLGLIGLAGRASAQALDLRAQFPVEPYDRLDVRMATHRNGDVAARVTVRFEEVFESLRLIRQIIELIPPGAIRATLPAAPAGAFALGLIEGWRGEVLIALETGANGAIARCHAHDPSWQNWPVIEHAVIDNIVPDFPLINKSFNLSYSGQDL
jgi:Ni,Fe-hydrogenase III large subunit/Ni,Fe-hydrogenase III component G